MADGEAAAQTACGREVVLEKRMFIDWNSARSSELLS